MKRLNVKQDRIMIKRDSADEVTATGIVIPSVAQNKQFFGTIVAAGPKVIDYKINDHVLFESFGGDEITLNDEDFVLLREECIIGIVEEVA